MVGRKVAVDEGEGVSVKVPVGSGVEVGAAKGWTQALSKANSNKEYGRRGCVRFIGVYCTLRGTDENNSLVAVFFALGLFK
jgi:hypothetical protein